MGVLAVTRPKSPSAKGGEPANGGHNLIYNHSKICALLTYNELRRNKTDLFVARNPVLVAQWEVCCVPVVEFCCNNSNTTDTKTVAYAKLLLQTNLGFWYGVITFSHRDTLSYILNLLINIWVYFLPCIGYCLRKFTTLRQYIAHMYLLLGRSDVKFWYYKLNWTTSSNEQ